ncbi:hypothetical protein ACIBL6_08925 [Streptomyces sp. NPDC050400]|uniref:hypothetical protein n=1 Tax=Streptomyces sp. NPDC050400 TaxID=3365610 RepID=UPI003788484B
MDQGFAGLIGAFVGICGAVGATQLAGRGQREQWRNALRRDSYGQFLARSKRAARAGEAVVLAMREDCFERGLYVSFVDAVTATEDALSLVLLEGPPALAYEAEQVVSHLDTWRWVVERWHDGDGTLSLDQALESTDRYADRTTDGLEKFTDGARRLLHGHDFTRLERLWLRLDRRRPQVP